MPGPPDGTPDLSNVIDLYRRAFKAAGPTRAALLDPKDRHRERFDALTAPIKHDGFSVLDYGCGLADLKDHLDERFSSYSYAGVDIVEEFIDTSRARHPESEFRCIRGVEAIDGDYDFIIVSGVFSLAFADVETHQAYMNYVIRSLFARTRVALCVDFMRSDVQFRQEGSYHQDMEPLDALAASLTPRYVLDKSYLPYEFALIAYRDGTILHPQSTFSCPLPG